MSRNPDPPRERTQSADAPTGGGAHTDRGGRDAGMPGPARGLPPGTPRGLDESTGSTDTDATVPPADDDGQETHSAAGGQP